MSKKSEELSQELLNPYSKLSKSNEKVGWIYEILSSFQEIYWEQIRDLIVPENSMKQLNKAWDYEPTIITVKNAENVYKLLEQARENRIVAETAWNSRSSRSHSLFQLIIKASHPNVNNGKISEGAINLIDLAGSERLHKLSNDKQILNESVAINKSLSSLRDVIGKLVEREKNGKIYKWKANNLF